MVTLPSSSTRKEGLRGPPELRDRVRLCVPSRAMRRGVCPSFPGTPIIGWIFHRLDLHWTRPPSNPATGATGLCRSAVAVHRIQSSAVLPTQPTTGGVKRLLPSGCCCEAHSLGLRDSPSKVQSRARRFTPHTHCAYYPVAPPCGLLPLALPLDLDARTVPGVVRRTGCRHVWRPPVPLVTSGILRTSSEKIIRQQAPSTLGRIVQLGTPQSRWIEVCITHGGCVTTQEHAGMTAA